MRWLAVFALLLPVYGSTNAWADDEIDPPARVGHFSVIKGKVSFKPAAMEEWGEAVKNRPITIGDSIWVDDDSRAELHIGSTAIRLDQFTAVNVLGLDDDVIQLGVMRGRVSVTVRRLDQDDVVELDLPNAAARIRASGFYVLSHDDDTDASRIAVRRGNLDVTANGSTFDVDEGQSALFNGNDDISYDLRRIAQADGFEQWAQGRDDREDDLVATRYVPREMTGYQDLDEHGTWSTTADYGAIWYPTTVPVGWVPYRSGHWTYIAPWGWTWVDDMPWGFAPTHYGRWVSWRGRWGWCPGQIVARPVYAPALVAWTGGVSVSVGWFPLGPREVYVPSFAASPVWVRRVNVTHVAVTNITSINVTTYNYVNRSYAYTTVPQDTFIYARPVAPAVIAYGGVPPPVVTHVPIAPRRESLYYSRAVNAPIRPPQQVLARPVMTLREPVRPPAPMRVPSLAAPSAAPVRPAVPQRAVTPPRPMRAELPPPRQATPYAPPRGNPNPGPRFDPPGRDAPPRGAMPGPSPSAPPRGNASPGPRFDPPPQRDLPSRGAPPSSPPRMAPPPNAPSRGAPPPSFTAPPSRGGGGPRFNAPSAPPPSAPPRQSGPPPSAPNAPPRGGNAPRR